MIFSTCSFPFTSRLSLNIFITNDLSWISLQGPLLFFLILVNYLIEKIKRRLNQKPSNSPCDIAGVHCRRLAGSLRIYRWDDMCSRIIIHFRFAINRKDVTWESNVKNTARIQLLNYGNFMLILDEMYELYAVDMLCDLEGIKLILPHCIGTTSLFLMAWSPF